MERIDTGNTENLFDADDGHWAFASMYHMIDTDTREILYGFREYNSDSGTVFTHNSAGHIGLVMMQFHFGFVERNAHSAGLPEDFPDMLQAAYKSVIR